MGKYIVAISPRERQSVTVYCASMDAPSHVLSFVLDFMSDVENFYRHKVLFDSDSKYESDNTQFLKHVKRRYRKNYKTAISFTLSFIIKSDMDDFVENFYEFLDIDELY